MTLPKYLKFAAVVCTFGVLAISSRATPYASGVTNNAGTISFVLNESADNVKVLLNNGAITNDLGALGAGVGSFNLNGATNYQIVVRKVAPPGYITATGAVNTNSVNKVTNQVASIYQISKDTNTLVNFYTPRGIAINRNPSSPYFGRVYVSNSGAGTTSANGVARTVGDGIYMLNADLTDANGLGDTASTGGLDFVTSGTNAAPYRLNVGPDGNLYICDWSDSSGNLYYTDPNVISASPVLKALTGSAVVPLTAANNHGSISAAYVEGSLSAGNFNVYTIDEDMQTDKTTATKTQLNGLWKYTIGSGPLPFGSDPTKIWSASGKEGIASASQTMDMDRGTNGFFYITTFRSAGNESGFIVRSNSSTVFISYSATTNIYGPIVDAFNNSAGVSVSPDQSYVAVVRTDNRAWVMPLTNDIPDISRRLWLDSFSAGSNNATIRAIRFDAANNLYVACQTAQTLRVFSAGGNTIATTGNDITGTNGTFNLQRIDPWIYTQPTAVTTNAGGNAAFSVVATGPNLTYQWQFNGVNLANATNTVLSLSNVQRTTNYGNYRCIITSTTAAATNSITSDAALLNVVDTVPIITAQSSDTSTNAGTSPKLTVTAVGSGTLTYQWYFNGTPISAATTSALTISNVQEPNEGTYQVVVANYFGSTPSADIALTVDPSAPVITTQPKGATNVAGTNFTFSVVSTGTDPRTYQWAKDGTNIIGATNISLVISNAQAGDSGGYAVTISNSEGSTPSGTTQLLIADTPSVIIGTQPKGLTNGAGVNLAFTVAAFGNPTLTYQWYTNGNAVANATNSAFTWINPQVEDSGSTVYVTVQNTSGPLSSSTVLIGVTNKVPTIVTQPVDFAGAVGGTATNVVVAQGENPLTYQWRLNAVAIPGATDAALVLNNLQSTNAGSYTVVVTDTAGSTTSAAALLAVSNAVTAGTGTGLIGEYFTSQWYLFASPNNTNSIASAAAVTRVDPTVDFLWATGSPDSLISTDYFVARWSGQVQPMFSENYTFYVKSDDGFRLWVGGKLILDSWSSGAKNTSAVVSNLVAGQKYDIRLEYLEITGTSECHLLWSSTSQLKKPVQTTQLYTNSAPVIVVGPANTVTSVGSSPSLTVTVDPNQPATGYQLLFNTNVVASSTSPTFTLSNIQVANAGLYQIVATNTSGASTSSIAVVTVTTTGTTGTGTGLTGDYFSSLTSSAAASSTNSLTNSPTISRLDATVDFNFGSWYADPAISVDTFIVRWTGQVQPQFSQTYTFATRSDDGLRLWVDGVLLIDHWANGATNTHNYAATMPYAFVANQKYDVRMEYFDNATGSEAHLMWSSASQPLQIIPTTQLYSQSGAYAIVHPKNTTVLAGNSTNLVVVAGGAGPISYQWKKNGSNIPGATTSSLPLNAVPYADNGSTYSVVVSNSISSRLSTNAVLTVTSPAFISIPPQSQAVPLGSNATFTVTAGGTAPFTYQWKKDNVDIAGATTSSLTITNVQNSDVAGYSVGVTNSLGGAVSTSAALTIGSVTAPPPTIGSVAVTGGSLGFSVSTATGFTYTIQFKADLNDANWTDVESFAGTGGTVNKSYPVGTGKGFYRIVVQ